MLLTYVSAAESSFYSLYMWRPIHGGDINWNPGNRDWRVGSAIDDRLREAIRKAPTGSAAQKELDRREQWLWGAVHRTSYAEPADWWAGPSQPDSSTSTS